ncbi:glycerophosphodiester phosphodiesterase [Nitratireductor mangrovi]|uniref:Glycerophosphodiester phosphodiesterase n=1 Tax=Nitratireductor mangrovi TaxID=2599600 RepID=A0A5B8L3T1_9HYPH|nr:glycerophosphodiester phosphodiesterase [Nitratireductor mangrovi]QDZ02479.1 glycerophosphodiester phosphodiesterase [Nitratireductor mangrovi]
MSGLSWLVERPIAHRGLHDLNQRKWENTLSAFAAAADKGYSIECDVHLAADGVPMVFHDRDLERLTGQKGKVFDKTATELGAMTVGGTGDRIPTLAESLAEIAGRVPVVIELKGVEGKDDRLVAAVAADLAGYRGHAAIMSFDHWLVRRFATDAPGITAGLTASGNETAELEAHFSMLAHSPDFVSWGVADLPSPFVAFVRGRLGLPVITWTVLEPADIQRTFAHADQMTFEGFEPPLAR